MAISSDLFREVFRRWPSGAAVVTSCDHNRPHGMVISSFVSLTNDPPLVMFSAGSNARMNRIVAEQKQFAVSILSGEQTALFERFAGFDRTFDANRFAGLTYATARTGMPIFPEAMAWVDCNVVDTHPGPGFTIFIGEIVAASIGETSEQAPMIYFRRKYSAHPYESDDPQGLLVDQAHRGEFTQVAADSGEDHRTIELVSGG